MFSGATLKKCKSTIPNPNGDKIEYTSAKFNFNFVKLVGNHTWITQFVYEMYFIYNQYNSKYSLSFVINSTKQFQIKLLNILITLKTNWIKSSEKLLFRLV